MIRPMKTTDSRVLWKWPILGFLGDSDGLIRRATFWTRSRRRIKTKSKRIFPDLSCEESAGSNPGLLVLLSEVSEGLSRSGKELRVRD
jgi:hypothetical protein